MYGALQQKMSEARSVKSKFHFSDFPVTLHQKCHWEVSDLWRTFYRLVSDFTTTQGEVTGAVLHWLAVTESRRQVGDSLSRFVSL